MMSLYEELIKISDENRISENVPLKNHTTFRVGGAARYFIEVAGEEELSSLIRYFNKNAVPYYLLGNGSNLLVGDKGFDGVILSLRAHMSDIKADGKRITCQAGALLSTVAMTACKNSLCGMEFASGIPGTIGGAVVMNAGAYGGEISQILKEVTVVNADGDIEVLPASELKLSYRMSIFKEKPLICTRAVFELEAGDENAIRARMEQLKEERKLKQPLEYPSAGSTFKRPEGYFAGKLIMDSGLAGYRVGGAEVSKKHCGFVINSGNAAAADILKLIRNVTDIVKEKQGVLLEPEVIMLGDF